MRSDGEPVLHALSVEPRSTRAEDIVRVVFRTRNLGTRPSPAGRVVFALGDGLDAVDATEVDVEPVEPGEYVVAAMSARVAVPSADRSEIEVRAALHLADAVLGTNACTVIVYGHAVLDGPASGTFVEAVDADTVRVRAVVTNEGDGPACGVRIVVPPPIGCVLESPPIDCVAADGDGMPFLACEKLEPGECAELAFDARIVRPVARLCADAGEVRLADGRRIAVPVRDTVIPHAVIAPPRVAVTPSRRRVDVAVDVRNDGWVDALDVPVRIALPAALRLVDGSIVVDGVRVEAPRAGRRGAARGRAVPAVARASRDGAAHAIVVSAVPARSIARVTLAATVPAAYRDGTMTVTVDAHTVDVPFAAESVRDVRVRVAESPLTAAPGEMVRIVARVVNAGDVAETLSLGITDGTAQVGVLDDASSAGVADDTFALNIANSKPQVEPKAQCRTLAPGAAAVVALQWRVPSDVPDGDVVEPAVVVSDVSGERARGVCAMVVRDRAWLSLEAPPMVDGTRVRYTIRNSGSTTARDVEARFAHATVQVEAIAAGATTFVEVDQCDVGSGGSLSIARREVLALPCIDDRVPAVVHAAFHAPERVVAGAAFMLRLDLDLEDAVDVLAVRVPGIAGCRYVPGSTRLDGRIVLDRAACTSFGDVSPLDGDGLFLRGVAGGTRVSLAWSLIADTMLCDEPLAVSAVLDVDGETRPIAPVQIAVFARDAFPARPAGARYHVEACTVAQPEVEACIVAPSEAEACTVAPPGAANMLVAEAAADLEAVAVPAVALAAATAPLSVLVDSGALPRGERRVAFSMRLDSERVDDVARLLHGARGPGLVAHVFMMRLFFPDAIEVRDVSASDALDAVRDALRDVFDRLFVKLRIPGFDVSSDDLEDPVLRRALLLLFERLDGVVPERIAFEESPGVFDRDTVRRIRSDCADAPYGAPALLRALVALLPSSCDDDPALATALRRYASLLDAVLSRYEGLPLELFDDALARRADAALDDARDGILTALRAHVPVAPVAC